MCVLCMGRESTAQYSLVEINRTTHATSCDDVAYAAFFGKVVDLLDEFVSYQKTEWAGPNQFFKFILDLNSGKQKKIQHVAHEDGLRRKYSLQLKDPRISNLTLTCLSNTYREECKLITS